MDHRRHPDDRGTRSRQNRAAPNERVDAFPIVQFFRSFLLPISLGLFLLPLILAVIGILTSYMG